MTRRGARIRLGIVGLGVIGRRHLELALREPACRVVSVADRSAEVSGLAARHSIPLRPSHREMLGADRPDGVIVATPTRSHGPIGLDLARNGTPALIEKPFTDSLAAGLELLAAIASTGVPVCVGHHRRFDPAVAATTEILRSGRIGRLVGISGIWAARKPCAYFESAWRREPGGGPVLINMIHDIDMLRHWCGEVESVYAETTPSARGFPVEDSGAILLRFVGGVRATLAFSDRTPSPWGWERATGDNPDIPATGENCYRFFGSAGSFEFPAIRLWETGPGGESCWTRVIRPESVPVGPRAALADQLRHFCGVVRGEEPPVVSGEDGLATLAVAEAVHESARVGRPVEPQFRRA